VDDDPEIREIITAILDSVGYAVTAVSGANPAIKLLSDEPPDVILTGIHMAEGDGFEFINAVRARGLDIPIVAMSGGAENSGIGHLEYARKLGAVGIVDKPFRSSHLAEAIDRALAGRSAPHRKS
jgi:two-component system response regulator FixJ